METSQNPTENWQGVRPTAAQVLATSAFWDVHGYQPVLCAADMFPHECEECRTLIAGWNAARERAKANRLTRPG